MGQPEKGKKGKIDSESIADNDSGTSNSETFHTRKKQKRSEDTISAAPKTTTASEAMASATMSKTNTKAKPMPAAVGADHSELERTIEIAAGEVSHKSDQPQTSAASQVKTGPSVEQQKEAGTKIDKHTGIDHLAIRDIMQNIYGDIGGALVSYMSDHGCHGQQPAEFEIDPPKELEDLYEVFLGTKDWRGRLLELQNCAVPCTPPALFVIRGLVGAALHKEVFLTQLPWDLEHQFREALGENVDLWEEAMDERGYRLSDKLKHVAYKQIRDKRFRDTTVSEHARKLAQRLVLTLKPHLVGLPKLPTRKPFHQCELVNDLERVFREGLILKQKMESADYATYEYLWFEGEEQYDRRRMAGTNVEGNTGFVVVTLSTGIMAHSRRQSVIAAPSKVWVSQVSRERDEVRRGMVGSSSDDDSESG